MDAGKTPGLHLSSTPCDTSAQIVAVRGSLDAATSNNFAAFVDRLFKSGCNRLVLDMHEVTHISSAGVGVLVDAMSWIETHNGKIVFAGVRDNIRKGPLRLVGIADLMVMTDDVEAAKQQVSV
jgi:anti-anti-sigma factor